MLNQVDDVLSLKLEFCVRRCNKDETVANVTSV